MKHCNDCIDTNKTYDIDINEKLYWLAYSVYSNVVKTNLYFQCQLYSLLVFPDKYKFNTTILS